MDLKEINEELYPHICSETDAKVYDSDWSTEVLLNQP